MMATCKGCSGRGYSGGGIDAEDVGFTVTCKQCGGKCACGGSVYALGLCKPCYFKDTPQ